MMAWTLWVVINTSGIFTAGVQYMSAPMLTQDACMNAGKQMLKNSKGVAIFCIGSEKGDFIKVEQ